MSDEIIEVWKPIPEFENYEASNTGKLRSWWRWGQHELSKIPNIINGAADKDGYRKITLVTHKNGVKKVHTKRKSALIALTFLGERPKGLNVCHKNGVRDDDRPDNLEYKSQRENILDKFKHGTMDYFLGENNPKARFTEKQIKQIRASKQSLKILAKKYNAATTTILGIKTRKTWKWLD